MCGVVNPGQRIRKIMDCSFDSHFCFLGLSFLHGITFSQLLRGLVTENTHVDRDTRGAHGLTRYSHSGEQWRKNVYTQCTNMLPTPHPTRSNINWWNFAANWFFLCLSPFCIDSSSFSLNFMCSEFWGPDPGWAPITTPSVSAFSLQFCCFLLPNLSDCERTLHLSHVQAPGWSPTPPPFYYSDGILPTEWLTVKIWVLLGFLVRGCDRFPWAATSLDTSRNW